MAIASAPINRDGIASRRSSQASPATITGCMELNIDALLAEVVLSPAIISR